MVNIRHKNVLLLMLLLFFLVLAEPQRLHAQGNYVWLYAIDPFTTEEDFIAQYDFLQQSGEAFVVLIDLSEEYKKRILYLLGEYQHRDRFLIAVSNTPKFDSKFIKKELFQYFDTNLIFDEDEDSFWFLADTGKKYRRIAVEEEISQIIDLLKQEESYAYLLRSDAWHAGNVSNISQYIKQEKLGAAEQLQPVKLAMFNQADSLKWFNTLGKFVMFFYFIVLVVFVLFMILFRSWSKRRFRKKESG